MHLKQHQSFKKKLGFIEIAATASEASPIE